MLAKAVRCGISIACYRLARVLAPELYRPPPETWALERLAQQQQLAVCLHKRKPRIRDRDRLFWVVYRTFFPGLWLQTLRIVQPDTVVRWHRNLVRIVWRMRSRPKSRRRGRPRLQAEIRATICRMATENGWGATRIHGELLKLGIDVSERSVSRILKRQFPIPADRLRPWRAFLRNEAVAAMDFLVVPTASFGFLYALVLIGHGRRKVLHVNVTAHPTAAWVSQQLREAFPGDEPAPRYLVHDQDSIFCSHAVQETLRGMNIVPSKIAFRCPWQNGVCERFVGTVRRELLDHVIVLGERHLRRLLGEYARYYNTQRTHLTLNKDSPLGRAVESRPSPSATLIAVPHLGGLHHHYAWRNDPQGQEGDLKKAA